MKRALVTGATGQDGWYLCKQLLDQDWIVYGMVRWNSEKPRDLAPGTIRVDGDLTDATSCRRALDISSPDVVFNLGALASSGQSWAQPLAQAQINGLGPLNMLEAIRHYGPSKVRFVQASTSEQYGRVNELPQSEKTPFGSMNVYGIAKTFAHQCTINYRDSFGIHASTALMHNHISKRRNQYFVDRKVIQAACRIKLGLQEVLYLGNTETARDWGWAPEYMQAWQLIAEHDEPGDYVIATGISTTVQQFVEMVFSVLDLDHTRYVQTDPDLFRPTDVKELRGDPSYIKKTLGWYATFSMPEMVSILVADTMDRIRSTE